MGSEGSESYIEDCIVHDTEEEYNQREFEVVPHEKSGPKSILIVHLSEEFEAQKKTRERDGGNGNCPGKISEDPEVSVIQRIEREIKKELSICDNRSKLRLNRPSVFEEEDVTMSKKLPVFLGKEFFKFSPQESDASSIDTETTDDRTDDGSDDIPRRPTKEIYLNFTDNRFNYSFPFRNNAVNNY